MLADLQIRKLAYDWREEHVASFDAEVEAMKARGIELTAWWFPGTLDATARKILEVIRRHGIRPQLWVMGGGGAVADEDAQRVQVAQQAALLKPLAEAAVALGCQVGLYNHGGWFGEPENQVQIIQQLAADGIRNVGIVYNFHHGHGHIGRFPAVLAAMKPYLLAVNLNGMEKGGDERGRKILAPGEGTEEGKMMQALQDSGWQGPVGIIDHLPETDSAVTLRRNLQGLEWLRKELRRPGSGGASPFQGVLAPDAVEGKPASGTTVFAPEREPLHPERHPWHRHPINRDRVYDYYAKQALFALAQPTMPEIMPAYPGLDGGVQGHWGNQNEETWRGEGWAKMDVGGLQAGVFRGWGMTIPRAVCVQLGEQQEVSACFDPETLTWRAAWTGGFLRIGTVRHGFLEGLQPEGKALPLPSMPVLKGGDREYLGYWRRGRRTIFHYRVEGQEWLDAAWAQNGAVVHQRVPADSAEGKAWQMPSPAQWPQQLVTVGTRGEGAVYAVDTVELPAVTPWNSVFHLGDHDFFPDGTGAVCTIEGEVWLVRGLDAGLQQVTWKRFAAGLHQPLGLRISGGAIHVLGRDQITRLVDHNGDGEADDYQCFSNAWECSPAGHDFITGLQQDSEGRFYFASSREGICRISADGKKREILAHGFRNPDGLAVGRTGEVLAAVQEGEWTPASMLMSVTVPGRYYGYGGPAADGVGRELPLVYLPRGVDNSCGGQAFVEGGKWGMPEDTALHFSFGTGTAFAVMRDAKLPGQGGVMALPGEFASGAHRGRFHPGDGQLWVSGTAGWGTYTPRPGCLQRLRYTGKPIWAPIGFEARANGVLLRFAERLPEGADKSPWVVQAWNYRYGPAYGSDEFRVREPHVPGHDVLGVRSITLAADGASLFLEIPGMVPCDTLHLHNRSECLLSTDLFLTVHQVSGDFMDFPGYQPSAGPPPGAGNVPRVSEVAVRHPVPWEKGERGRDLRITATTGLQYAQTELTVRAGERISLVLENPDVVPHNWVLGTPGSGQRLFELSNRMITDPAALARHYVPDVPEVLVYTRLVEPANSTTVHFDAPAQPGEYPYLCTFPGHGMIMRGVLTVK